MLSNHLFNQQKIILIKDEYGIEPKCEKLVSKWLREQRGDAATLETVTLLQTPQVQSPHLFGRVSKLARCHRPAELFAFVDSCRKSDFPIQQLFLWATVKNMTEQFLIPYLEHMAEVVVSLEDDRHLSILSRKTGGSISNRQFQYQIDGDSMSVKEIKKRDQLAEKPVPIGADPPVATPSTTFKIGDLKKDEQEARDALTLPFEFYKSTPEGGRILYHPDAEDDLDEEDPDDDLMI
ncbi:elongator complex protein 5 [Uranotaenia lowii]|uniref:elongator complex protein 5 n=1 Tax=Uranotaenia lowii TaxID=190385 RepID=UPI002479ED7F|nr:elongator complex protein 5 [Uranotaenia lowii]XP_055612231.1 elongator complex protein 5 [Uranotaenia lowii]